MLTQVDPLFVSFLSVSWYFQVQELARIALDFGCFLINSWRFSHTQCACKCWKSALPRVSHRRSARLPILKKKCIKPYYLHNRLKRSSKDWSSSLSYLFYHFLLIFSNFTWNSFFHSTAIPFSNWFFFLTDILLIDLENWRYYHPKYFPVRAWK